MDIPYQPPDLANVSHAQPFGLNPDIKTETEDQQTQQQPNLEQQQHQQNLEHHLLQQDQAIQEALKESLNDTQGQQDQSQHKHEEGGEQHQQEAVEQAQDTVSRERDFVDEQEEEDEEDEEYNPYDDQENLRRSRKRKKGPGRPPSKVSKEVMNSGGPRPLKGIFEITQLYHNKHWKCRACDFSSRAKDQALKHLKKVHMKQKKVYPRTKYPCQICGREYWKEVGRDNHMQKVHNVDFDLKVKTTSAASSSSSVKKEPPAGTFPCPKCSEPFKNEKSLQDHLPHCLVELECGICGTVFERGETLASKFKASFQRHEKNCRRIKIYNRNCPYCDKYFARPYQCRRHIPTCKVRKSGKKKILGKEGEDEEEDDDEDKEEEEEEDDEPEEEFEDTPDSDDDD